MGGFWNQWVGWGEEVTYGTLVARTAFARMFKGTNASPEIPREPVTRLGNRFADDTFDKTKSGRWKIITPLVYDGLELLFKHAFGDVVTAGAGPYTHTFDTQTDPYTRAVSPLVGLSGEVNAEFPTASNEALLVEGGRCTEFGAEFRIDEEIKWDMDVVAEDVTIGAKSGAPTFPDYDTELVIPSQITIELDDVAESVVAASFRVNNNLRVDRAFLGSTQIAGPLPAPGKATLTGTIEKEWENQDLWNDWVNGTEAKVEILGSLDANRKWELTIPRVKYTGETPEPDEGGSLPQSAPFMAMWDSGAGYAARLVVTNNSATP